MNLNATKRFTVAIATTLLISTVATYGIYYTKISEDSNTQNNEITKMPFPSKGIHYSEITSNDYVHSGSDIEIYISLTSNNSFDAYKEVTKFAKENNLSLNTYHLSQNPEWEYAARTFHTLKSIKPDIELDAFFNIFINNNNPKNITNAITPILTKEKINTSTFKNTYSSFETIKQTNHHLEHATQANIEFIPTVILFGKYYIHFGSFDSYTDSMRLIHNLKSE